MRWRNTAEAAGLDPAVINRIDGDVRRLLSNLAYLILDEAHTYDGALGTHCLYQVHRLQQKRRDLMSRFEPPRVIAASATIHNPAQHLETQTGLPFQVVDDRYDGSPRAELTVQHSVGCAPHDEGWRDLQNAVWEYRRGPEPVVHRLRRQPAAGETRCGQHQGHSRRLTTIRNAVPV